MTAYSKKKNENCSLIKSKQVGEKRKGEPLEAPQNKKQKINAAYGKFGITSKIRVD